MQLQSPNLAHLVVVVVVVCRRFVLVLVSVQTELQLSMIYLVNMELPFWSFPEVVSHNSRERWG